MRFKSVSQTSSNEVKSITYLAHRLGYVGEQQRTRIILLTEELSKMINAFSRALNK
ncbi:four helix bundle protein [Spirosoma sp.]|uniref:four helix bundle protein n=1 Tax=Spirosoma sp. TaxID=1899569 RepID=UPI00343E07BF